MAGVPIRGTPGYTGELETPGTRAGKGVTRCQHFHAVGCNPSPRLQWFWRWRSTSSAAVIWSTLQRGASTCMRVQRACAADTTTTRQEVELEWVDEVYSIKETFRNPTIFSVVITVVLSIEQNSTVCSSRNPIRAHASVASCTLFAACFAHNPPRQCKTNPHLLPRFFWTPFSQPCWCPVNVRSARADPAD